MSDDAEAVAASIAAEAIRVAKLALKAGVEPESVANLFCAIAMQVLIEEQHITRREARSLIIDRLASVEDRN